MDLEGNACLFVCMYFFLFLFLSFSSLSFSFSPVVLVLAPTRELVQQINQEVEAVR